MNSQKAYCRDRRALLKSAGLCIDCKETNTSKGMRCFWCAQRNSKTQQSRYRNLVNNGICRTCRRENDRDDRVECRICANKRRKRDAEHRPPKIATGRVIENGETSWEKIGEALSLSPERVRQIYIRTMVKLWVACEEFGMDPKLLDIRSALAGSVDAVKTIGRGFSSIALCERWAR